ncbi:UbiA family prenyltransferase [Actinokineospora sp. UTMC 2448]|uniref:UbiA family prenyltransferase n=1 Tax=Actinokineospora sp. UTMC 2448 TaxID=2268449 RepID=UPI00216462F3|nr:UbiA family prenyltransferase [Actinokineospora sp. UTMC 2448]
MQQAVRTGAALAMACHPAPTLTVTALAAALAAAAGRSAPEVVGLAVAVLCGQLSVGWLNDLLDAPRDAAVGRSGKPVAEGRVSRRTVGAGVIVAAVAALALTSLFGLTALLAHTAALASAWAYDLGVKSTAFSVVPYTVSFALLPVIVGPAPLWLMAAAATLGSAAHFANAIPDLADDLATGVRGLPHRIGARSSILAAAALMLATGVLLALGPPGPPTPLALAALGVAGTILAIGVAKGGRAPFAAVMAVALVDVAVATHVLT